MEGGGGEGSYIVTIATLSPPEWTFALRWAAMRAILMFQVRSDGQSHKTVSANHNLFEEERRAQPVSNRGPFAYQPNA